MMFKNLTDNAKNLAANAKIEDMSKLFKNHMAGKPDVKNALSGVMVTDHNISFSFFFFFSIFSYLCLILIFLFFFCLFGYYIFSFNNKEIFLLSKSHVITVFILAGHLQGSGEESFAETVRDPRRRSRHDQAVLPRRR